jgi:hypothetical protein
MDINLFGFYIPIPLNGEKRFFKMNVLSVNVVQIRLAHAEVMYSIQNVGFTASVFAHQTIYSGR